MEEIKRLGKVAKELNVGVKTIIEFLSKKGHTIETTQNTKVSSEIYYILLEEFQKEKFLKEKSKEATQLQKRTIAIEKEKEDLKKAKEEEILIKDVQISEPRFKILGKIDIEATIHKKRGRPKKKIEETKEVTEKEPEKKIDEITPTKIIEKPIEEKLVVEEEIIPKKEIKIVGKIDLDSKKFRTRPPKKTKEEKEKEREERKKQKETKPKEISAEKILDEKLPITIGTKLEAEIKKADFTEKKEHKFTRPPFPRPGYREESFFRKKKRKRIKKKLAEKAVGEEEFRYRRFDREDRIPERRRWKKYRIKVKPTKEEVDKQIKETRAQISTKEKSRAVKYRREKRQLISQHIQEELQKQEIEKKILKVTEFVTANELAILMDVPVNAIIETCLNLGYFVSINQRLDAELISIVAEEFGYKVNFITVEEQVEIKDDEIDDTSLLVERPPIVTVMGHVDHGKTKLLDWIRNTNVVAGEAGGITQHIGAYSVNLNNNKNITFIDTPGHEAFTAMRARGAKVTDIVIIVVAADEGVMPQTVEAINHAQAANVPIIFAINKIDKPEANVEKVKEQLSNMNFLVEDWGGKYQSQGISAKFGTNVDLLLEKVLLEAEYLELKANPNKKAFGTVIESSLEKGKGYISTVLVQNGILKIGDYIVSGPHYGKVKALQNERRQDVKEVGLSMVAIVLGLNGSPQAGEKFKVMETEKEAKEIALKRLQLQREQNRRTRKHITLDEIGRRIAIGNFKELNFIVKGDVDGSIEALSDALIKLSIGEVLINVIHKSVGQITESDVLLASASNAIIIGFQVRPSPQARKLAEQEQVDIRLYSIIYDAINQVKDAIEGMLAPKIEEKVICNLEVKEIFKISKVGTVAGCLVLDGKITRNTKIRLIRDGIVVHTGELSSLKRFKDDVKEVSSRLECGLSVLNFNDIKIGDIIEGYEIIETKRKL